MYRFALSSGLAFIVLVASTVAMTTALFRAENAQYQTERKWHASAATLTLGNLLHNIETQLVGIATSIEDHPSVDSELFRTLVAQTETEFTSESAIEWVSPANQLYTLLSKTSESNGVSKSGVVWSSSGDDTYSDITGIRLFASVPGRRGFVSTFFSLEQFLSSMHTDLPGVKVLRPDRANLLTEDDRQVFISEQYPTTVNWRHNEKLNFGGSTWGFLWADSAATPPAGALRLPWIFFFGGLALTAWVTAQLYKSVCRARNAEASEKQMQTAVDNLETTNSNLEQFAYMASHDLQEPLRAVNGYLNLLDEHSDSQIDETGRLYISKAVAGATRMHQLIKELLKSTHQYSEEDFNHTNVDLNKVLMTARSDLHVLIDQESAEIKHANLLTVKGNESLLAQLFSNLLSNAIKYRKSNVPVRIDISSRTEGRYVLVDFKDNGIGIESDSQVHIFDNFTRLNHHDDRQGSGVGLSVCAHVVKLHHGRIEVTSSPGKGSTFTVFLKPSENS